MMKSSNLLKSPPIMICVNTESLNMFSSVCLAILVGESRSLEANRPSSKPLFFRRLAFPKSTELLAIPCLPDADQPESDYITKGIEIQPSRKPGQRTIIPGKSPNPKETHCPPPPLPIGSITRNRSERNFIGKGDRHDSRLRGCIRTRPLQSPSRSHA